MWLGCAELSLGVNVCVQWCTQGLFLLHAQRSQDRFQIQRNPDQDKALPIVYLLYCLSYTGSLGAWRLRAQDGNILDRVPTTHTRHNLDRTKHVFGQEDLENILTPSTQGGDKSQTPTHGRHVTIKLISQHKDVVNQKMQEWWCLIQWIKWNRNKAKDEHSVLFSKWQRAQCSHYAVCTSHSTLSQNHLSLCSYTTLLLKYKAY